MQEKEKITPFHLSVAIYSMYKTEKGSYSELVITLPHSSFPFYKLLQENIPVFWICF